MGRHEEGGPEEYEGGEESKERKEGCRERSRVGGLRQACSDWER